ncbi:hypothetical protein [Bradyrhizobium elkanii]|uniref:hypothetical protein n=1 Tax=Bradyrhizobium elkanii TaxID=29448 RepID=UPI00056DE582|nr:hypothetical protein [Bradyrhizobium elkanii]
MTTTEETATAPKPDAPKSGIVAWFKGWKTILESALVSAVVAGVVTVWGTARMETSKEYIASIGRQQSQLDSAQSALFSQLGLYTGKLFEKPDAASADQLQSAITTAQLQVNRLKNELPESQHPVLNEYSKELTVLETNLRGVKSRYDLGPVYASAQKLLALHDQVGETVRSNMYVSIWRPKGT